MTAEVHLATVTTSRRSPTIRACDLRVRLVLKYHVNFRAQPLGTPLNLESHYLL